MSRPQDMFGFHRRDSDSANTSLLLLFFIEVNFM